MRKLLVAVLGLLASTAVVEAQWGTPSFTMPVGRGPGVIGFNFVGPCLGTQVPTWTGPAAVPTCQYPGIEIDARNYGVVCDGDSGKAAANSTALNNALASGGGAANVKVNLPSGDCRLSATLNMPHHGTLAGAGRQATILTQTTAATPIITLPSAANYAMIRDLRLSRSVTATAGGDGIDQLATLDNILLENLDVVAQYNGFDLGSTGYSRIVNVTLYSNVNHGIAFSSKDGNCAFQWNMVNINVGFNGQDGINVNSGAATGPSCPMGDWTHMASFQNGRNGFRFDGAVGKTIEAVRINGAFLGADLGTAGTIVFDTHSTGSFNHNLSNIYTEASTYGIFVTVNNGPISCTACSVVGHSTAGIRWESASELTLIGGFIINNVSNGVSVSAGRMKAIGASFGNLQGIPTQTFSFGIPAGTGPHMFIGNNFSYGTGHTVAPISDASTNAGTMYRGNIGIADRYPSLTGANDANGNEVLLFSGVASAVNEFMMTNAATGQTPLLSVRGNDANVGMTFNVKGGGTYDFAGTTVGPTTVRLFEDVDNGFNRVALTVAASLASDFTLTLPSATDTLVGKATTDTLTNKFLDSAGTGNTLQVSSVTVSRGQFPGTNTNDNATAGNVGEVISSTLASGSAISLTTGTAVTYVTLALTAGDWDVDCNPVFIGNGSTTISSWKVSASQTTNTHSATLGEVHEQIFNGGVGYANATIGHMLRLQNVRVTLTGATNVFCVVSSIFGTSTASVYGHGRARRKR